MRKSNRFSILRLLVVALILLGALSAAFAGPTFVLAQESEGEVVGEGGSAESSDGAGVAVTMAIIGLVLLLVAVVAVIGAIGLGVIGIGYWSVNQGE